jgi:hypothetical protein
MFRAPKNTVFSAPLMAIGLVAVGGVVHAGAYLDRGHSFTQSTYLIEIAHDTPLSLKARGVRQGGFETATGEWVGFDRWYSTKWNDTRLSWVTQVNPNFGLVWGISSGERAEKYAIDPGVRLGFLLQAEPKKNNAISISGSAVIGGRLREKPCTADYGEIGGIQTVNCRLAASPLEPSQTLNYLYNEKPESAVHVRYRLSFN